MSETHHHAFKHGMDGTRPYRIWVNMRYRCRNPNAPNYARYGGRGIVVCTEWESFERFWQDMQQGYQDDLLLDRRNNNSGYSKKNCRWATPKEQQRNRSVNRFTVIDGRRVTIAEAAEIVGIEPNTIYERIKRGLPESRWLEPLFGRVAA